MVFCNNCHAGDNYEPQEAQEECVWTKIYDVAMNCDMWRSGCNTHAKWDMPEDGICPQCKGGIVAEQGEG
jgi:hypothetical protein